MLSVGLLRTKQNNRKLNCPSVLDNMVFFKILFKDHENAGKVLTNGRNSFKKAICL